MQRIIRNRIRCNTCGDIIESSSVHEIVSCSCGRVYVDGGLDYLRRGYKDGPEDFTEMAETEQADSV